MLIDATVYFLRGIMYNILIEREVIPMKNTSNSLKNQVIAMSNILAEKSTRFSVMQQKLFYVCIASLKHGINTRNEVEINKQELFNCLGIEKETGRYTRIKGEFEQLAHNSFVEFDTTDGFSQGFLIYNIRLSKNTFFVKFNDYYLPLVQELANNYVRLLDDDVISFSSKFSMMLYQNLMKDKWKLTNVDHLGIDYSTKQLKMMFGLSKSDYMRKNDSFNRSEFEKKTINKAIDEINKKSKCIKNLTYKKVKKGSRIQYYLFTYNYIDPQKVVEDARDEFRWEQLTIAEDIPTVEKPVRVPEEVKNYNWWE